MKKIGYMDGTDSFLLTKLAAAGVETVPLGNGFDNAGRYIGYLNPSDEVEAVVGYFHKFLPLKGSNVVRPEREVRRPGGGRRRDNEVG